MLLLCDEGERGPAWTDEKVVDAMNCGIATAARLRRRFTTEGLKACLRVIADRPDVRPRSTGSPRRTSSHWLVRSRPRAGRAERFAS
jgi:hypothetical protein